MNLNLQKVQGGVLRTGAALAWAYRITDDSSRTPYCECWLKRMTQHREHARVYLFYMIFSFYGMKSANFQTADFMGLIDKVNATSMNKTMLYAVAFTLTNATCIYSDKHKF